MNVIGLPRATFDDLLSVFSRHYVVRSGQGKPGRPARLLHKHVVLDLLLHYYASTMEIKNFCELFESPPSATERVIRHAERALEKSLVEIEDVVITWPSEDQQRTWTAWIEAREPPVKRKFGFIDGKNYLVASSNRELQNALYNGWLHSVLVTGTVALVRMDV